MAINFNNQNQGINSLDLSQFGLMQPQNTNMQTAGFFSSDAENALENIQDLRNQQNTITAPLGGDMELLQQNDIQYNNFQNLENQIEQLKQENINDQEFNDIGGQTAGLQKYLTPTTMNDASNNTMTNKNSVLKTPSRLFGGVTQPQGMNFEGARREMTQPGFTEQATVYDPYGIRVEDGRFSYDMNKTSVDNFNTQPSKRFKDHSNMKSYLQANPDMGQNIKNKIGSVFNQGKQGILNNPLVKGAGMAFNAATGNIPGLIMGGISMLGNQFADKTLYSDTIDENGNVYSADQLNKMNAAGGGYSNPARSARRRVNRIRKMKEREAAGKRISRKNLKILQAQEAAAQQARQAATTHMSRDNSKDNTGGYQAGYGSSFMGGSGTAAEMGSSAMGGIIGHGGMGGKPAQSGLASMFTRRR